MNAWTPAVRAEIAAEVARFDSIEAWHFGDRSRTELAIETALTAYGITFFDLISRRSTKDLVAARALVVWALRTIGGQLSYPKIGRIIARDHSTAVHLHGRAIALRLSDVRFAAGCNALLARACPQTQKGTADGNR